MREAPVHALVRERNRTKQTLPATENVVWECIGPTNVGGRMTSIVCHPKKPHRIWAGAAAGGVWQSEDAGRTWHALWRDHETLNIGSLAIDPKNPAVIYCGTGEANLSVDSYAGVGIYRTDDGGETWKLLASSDETGVPTRIGVIAIDPFDSKHLRIGGVGANESNARPKDFGGMFASHDGGATWRRESFVSRNNYWCHAIVFHPTKRRVIFAAFTEQGAKSGIWHDAQKTRNAFSAARLKIEAKLHDQPDDGVLLAMLGLIDAGLSRKQEAIAEGLRAVELRPISNDAVDGAAVIGNLAMIYAWVGDVDSAMERLVFLAKTPGGPDYGQLKLDPAWDAVRRDPRFAKMLDELQPASNRR